MNMSEKRFKIYQDSIRKFESDRIWGVKSETNSLEPYMTFKEAEKCCDLLNEQQATISDLQRKCFELEKDYLIETSDISDKIYLEDEINELKKEYGVDDE